FLTMIHDAKRFILSHISIIEKAPPVINPPLYSVQRRAKFVDFFGTRPPAGSSTCQLLKSFGTLLCRCLRPFRLVGVLVFSPDGYLLASASGAETVRLLCQRRGASRDTLEGHSD